MYDYVQTLTAEERVANGMQFLHNNCVVENWLQKINTEKFSIYSAKLCVLGQIYGLYMDGCVALGISHQSRSNLPSEFNDDSTLYRQFLGFSVGSDTYREEGNKVCDAWKRAIIAKKAAAKISTP